MGTVGRAPPTWHSNGIDGGPGSTDSTPRETRRQGSSRSLPGRLRFDQGLGLVEKRPKHGKVPLVGFQQFSKLVQVGMGLVPMPELVVRHCEEGEGVWTWAAPSPDIGRCGAVER